MGLIKSRHGVYNARVKVPARLQESVAAVLGGNKAKRSWLKKSLSTKDLKQANILAKPVLAEFDRIIARAEALVADIPLLSNLSPSEIERMANYHYAQMLACHDVIVREGPEAEIEFRNEFPDEAWTSSIQDFGLSGGQMLDAKETLARVLPEAEAALARGDIAHVAHNIADTVAVFRVRLDQKSVAYRDLGIAVLRAQVRALRAIAQRTQGEPVETPPIIAPNVEHVGTGETLKAAFEGWRKARNPAAGTLNEYTRAIALFVELHGDIPVIQIRKPHARKYREALQDMPWPRPGSLRKAAFAELATWGREHPEAPKISTGTVNKLLGGVQVIGLWARENGVIPDDVPWADPFAGMRLEEITSERESFTAAELRKLFADAVFTTGERPVGGKGDAAFWLPLLGLFTGARRGELAGLTVANAHADDDSGTDVVTFIEDRARAKSLKTEASARTVPVHRELIRLGWLQYVAHARKARGEHAWLFPLVSPEQGAGPLKAWTKWFNRKLRTLGVTDKNKVFHSLRHGFKDALRAARIPEDINDALTGHSSGSVGRGYGAKNIVHRFGMPALTEAVASLKYPGLDLSRVSAGRGWRGSKT